MWVELVFGLGLVILAAAIKLGPLDRPYWRTGLMVTVVILAVTGSIGQTWLILPSLPLLFSTLRLSQHRYGLARERRVLLRSTSWLALLVAILVAHQLAADLWPQLDWAYLASLLLAVVGGRAFALSLYRGYRYQYLTVPNKPTTTVTLAVPARNETHALTDHLRSAVGSRYTKLETLVLDDCSQDSTPDIVRSFASDGVRFVQGQQPAASWLGKNFAYQTLLEQASGDWVLFAGVDIRFAPDSIQQLVALAETSQADLVSVMPYRRNFDWQPTLIRPPRYFWQLAIGTWPMMNSCWLVRRDWLLKQGGFRLFRHSITPERDLASLAREQGTYQFVLSTPALGVTTRKRAGSQIETAKRTLYPLMKREVVWLWLKTLALASWLVLPWLGGIGAAGAMLMLAGWSLLWLAHFVCEMVLQPRHWWLSAWWLPLNIASEVWLGVISAFGYEYGQVNWKERNICLPVLAQDARSRSR